MMPTYVVIIGKSAEGPSNEIRAVLNVIPTIACQRTLVELEAIFQPCNSCSDYL